MLLPPETCRDPRAGNKTPDAAFSLPPPQSYVTHGPNFRERYSLKFALKRRRFLPRKTGKNRESRHLAATAPGTHRTPRKSACRARPMSLSSIKRWRHQMPRGWNRRLVITKAPGRHVTGQGARHRQGDTVGSLGIPDDMVFFNLALLPTAAALTESTCSSAKLQIVGAAP